MKKKERKKERKKENKKDGEEERTKWCTVYRHYSTAVENVLLLLLLPTVACYRYQHHATV